MNTKERHVRENESEVKRESEMAPNADLIGKSMIAEGKNRKRNSSRKINNLWLWFGVLVLVAILIWWLFSLGIFGDATNAFNG